MQPANINHQTSDSNSVANNPLFSGLLTQWSDLQIAAGLTLICALTRWFAIPASLWEWDDFLFVRAIHHYDLVIHSPHPPGFPVFVVLTRLAYKLLQDEHRALTSVAFLFAMWLAPALFYLFREIFYDRKIAITGALLGNFTPAIWVHACAGRSDGPGLVLGVVATALLLCGRRSNSALLWGCATLGIGAGVRVTVFTVAAPAMVFVLWQRLRAREWRLVVSALLITGVGVLVWYIPLIWHQTWETYQWVVNSHRRFIWENDSLFAQNENGVISYRLSRFFLDVWGVRWLVHIIYSTSLIGLIYLLRQRQWATLAWLFIVFVPFLCFIFVTTTPLGAPLYAQAYLPLFLGLSACGWVYGTRTFLSIIGASNKFADLGLWLACCLALNMANWTYPIIKMLRQEKSPVVKAMQHINQTFDPKKNLLFYDTLLMPQTEALLQKFQTYSQVSDLNPVANLLHPLSSQHHIVGLSTTPSSSPSEKYFSWSNARGVRRLKVISLGRCFDVFVSDQTQIQNLLFLDGWWPQESASESTWRWMPGASRTALRNVGTKMQLRFAGTHAFPTLPNPSPIVTLRLNGKEVDKFVITDDSFERRLSVSPDPTTLWSVLEINIDKTVKPSELNSANNDQRDLGIRCTSLEWTPAEGSQIISDSLNQYAGEGWSSIESGNGSNWRRMEGMCVTHLPGISGDAELILRIAPSAIPQNPLPPLTIAFKDQPFQQLPLQTKDEHYVIRVPATLHNNRPLDLKLSLPSPASAADLDPSSLMFVYLGWQPASMKLP